MLQKNYHKVFFKSVTLFLVLYLLFLISWIEIKGFYGCVVSRIATDALVALCNVKFKSIQCSGEKSQVVVISSGFVKDRLADLEVNFPIRVSVYSFNVPLTLACVVCFLVLSGHFRVRLIFEVALILIATHVMYVFIFEKLHLMYAEHKAGMASLGGARQIVWELLWAFWDNLLIRFEPFIAVVYLFLRRL